MTALYILLGIAALFALILFLPVKLYARLIGDDFRLRAAVGPVSFQLVPEKKKKTNYKKIAKKLRGTRLSEYKKPPKTKKKTTEKKSAVSEMFADLGKDVKNPDFLRLLSDTLKYLANKLRHRLHVHFRRLNILVACGDAAKTGIACGAISQSLSYLIEFLRCNTSLTPCKNVSVTPDFLREKTYADIDAVVYIRIGSLLSAGIRTVFSLLKYKIKKENHISPDIRKETAK